MCATCDDVGIIFEVVETEDWYPSGIYWGENVREHYCHCEAGDRQKGSEDTALLLAQRLRENSEAAAQAGDQAIPF